MPTEPLRRNLSHDLRPSGVDLPDGLYPDLDFGHYRMINAINQTALKRLHWHSPAHAFGVEESDTKSTKLGTLVHAASLTPELYKARCVEINDLDENGKKIDGRTKAGKAIKAEVAEAQARGLMVLRSTDKAVVDAIGFSLSNHERAFSLLQCPQREVTALWADPETNVACKARFDMLATIDDLCIVGDLKTCQDARWPVFFRNVERYGYDFQAAFYLRGARALVPDAKRFAFVIIAVESAMPYAVNVWQFNDAMIEASDKEVGTALTTVASCIESDMWPQYQHPLDDIVVGYPPNYKRRIQSFAFAPDDAATPDDSTPEE